MGIERGNDEMEKVDREGEIRDEFGSGDQEQQVYDAGERSHVSCGCQAEACQGSVPYQAVEHPYEPQHPANSHVTAQTVPAEQQVEADVAAGDQGGEDDQDRGGDIVGELKEHNLGQDAQRGDISERAGPWGSTAASHA